MENISDQFNILYEPVKALLIYGHNEGNQGLRSVYIESYDIGINGKPINAHPLTIKESIALSELLQTSSELQNHFLRSKGVLPANVLFVNPDKQGYAVWYTPPQERNLLFIDKLTIPCGKAFVPGMIWKAGRDGVSVFAVKSKNRPQDHSVLYHAPFFNINYNGAVCMGNVRITIERTTHLQEFMFQWEQYFFNSYFSHTLQGGSIIDGNIVQLWQGLIDSDTRFPENVLIKTNFTLSSLFK